eukprot:SM000026S08849  [mRNA]  locus=s26:63028:70962:- [translate_table: standard]
MAAAAAAADAGAARAAAVAALTAAQLAPEGERQAELLRQLLELVVHRHDTRLLPEFLPSLLAFHLSPSAPVRKLLSQSASESPARARSRRTRAPPAARAAAHARPRPSRMVEEIGVKHVEHVPALEPVLATMLRQDAHAVAKHALIASTALFRTTLHHVARQVARRPRPLSALRTCASEDLLSRSFDISSRIHSFISRIRKPLSRLLAGQGCELRAVSPELAVAWSAVLRLKEAILQSGLQHEYDGVRLHAVKFVEMVILLYTQGPASPSGGKASPRSGDYTRSCGKFLGLAELLGLLIVPGSGLVVAELACRGTESATDGWSSGLMVLLSGLPPRPQRCGFSLMPIYSASSRAESSGQKGFSMEAIAGGHPLLDAAELSQEASRLLASLTSLLREPSVVSLPGPVAIVVIQSLSSIARQRVAFFGRVAPVLLALAPGCEVMRGGAQVASVVHALKASLVALLKCTNAGAMPWRDRIADALRRMNGGESVDAALRYLDRAQHQANKDGNLDSITPSVKVKVEDQYGAGGLTESLKRMHENGSLERAHENGGPGEVQLIERDGSGGAVVAKRAKVEPKRSDTPAQLMFPPLAPGLQQMVNALSELAAQGEQGAASAQLLVGSLPADMLADIVIFNMQHLGPPPSEAAPAVPPASDTANSAASSVKDTRRDPRLLDPRRTPAKSEDAVGILSPSLITSQSVSATHDLQTAQSPAPTASIDVKVEGSVMEVDQINELDKPQRAREVEGAMTVTVARRLPVVILMPQQQQAMHSAALRRIVDAHGAAVLAGTLDLRSALIARLLVQDCRADSAYKMLQEYLLEDYSNRKGHEVAQAVLFHLYAVEPPLEVPEDALAPVPTDAQRSQSSPQAQYDRFFLAMAGGVINKLPATDKSLQRLLCEAPVVPQAVLDVVGRLCQGQIEKPLTEDDEDDEEGGRGAPVGGGERTMQGLSTLWALLLHRPSLRKSCLALALQCTTHEQEEVRTVAIRLVANRLHPLSYLTEDIEEFATKGLLLAAHPPAVIGDGAEAMQPEEDVNGTAEERRRRSAEPAGTSSAAAEALRHMSLFLALCSRKHSLLGKLFQAYAVADKPARVVVNRQVPQLMRSIGPQSPDLLEHISSTPPECKLLLLKILHSLSEAAPLSPDIIARILELYRNKLKDTEILIPILPSLLRDQVMPIFPRLLDLPLEKFQIALARILQGSPHSGPALTPTDALIALHTIDSQRDKVPLKKASKANSYLCIFVENTPLPVLLLRTIIQALAAHPPLMRFVMELLSKLVNRQIWKMAKQLWVGFLKCAEQSQPHSFTVLLQLPSAQLEEALKTYPDLRAPLAAHAAQPSIFNSIPRSLQAVLGNAAEPLEDACDVQLLGLCVSEEIAGYYLNEMKHSALLKQPDQQTQKPPLLVWHLLNPAIV